MPAKILVTGGAGFIGWRCCETLAKQGNEIAIIDNLSVGMPMPKTVGYRTLEADIRDSEKISKFVADFKPETIIHLAAVHHIPTCERKRPYALDVNVVGTENLLEAAEKNNVETFTLASSGAVYAWEETALNEHTTALWPCDNYAISKSINEQQLKFWSDRTEGKAKACRIFNTIGHDDPNAHLIPDILNQLHSADGRAVIKLGNIAPRRDYIHANDTAEGVASVATSGLDDNYEIFNIASGVEISVEDLVRSIGKAMNVEIDIEVDETRLRRVDRMSQLADVSKIKNKLGWTAKISLSDALDDIVAKFPFQAN